MNAKAVNLATAVASAQQLSWDDLRLFLALSEGKSLRAAARALAVNASTVSRRLAQLEEVLGTPLFERHPAGLELTAAGKETARLASDVSQQIQRWQQRMDSDAVEVAGTIRITSAEVVGEVSSRCVAALAERYPKLHIEMNISDVMKNVERHEVDIAIRVADSPPEDLVGRRLGKSAVGLYASRGYLKRHPEPLTSGQHSFVEWPLIIRHKPAFAWVDKHFPDRHQVARGSSAQGVSSLIRAGVGIGALGVAQASECDDLVCLQRLPASCSTSVWLLTQRGAVKSARVRASLDFLAEALSSRASQFQ